MNIKQEINDTRQMSYREGGKNLNKLEKTAWNGHFHLKYIQVNVITLDLSRIAFLFDKFSPTFCRILPKLNDKKRLTIATQTYIMMNVLSLVLA